tara:strand:+ start:779 stop:3259 length:2481 start_codon:yes stop_codon:yes gene_type:complete
MTLAKNVSIFFRADTKAFQSGLDQMQRKLSKFSRQTQKLGRSITRNFSIPFALAGTAAVKMVADFDTSMTKLNTLVGISEGEIKKFKESVLELSGEVAQSPNELAEALFFLTSAGLKGANAMETLEAVSKGVAIGLGEQTDLAKVAGAAQNAYGADVLSSAEALDIFGAMVKTGMFESSELAAVLGKEAGFAAALGISFEELGAFISTYTRTTGDATSATVGVSGVMMAFTKETQKGKDALSKINMSYDELRLMLGEQGLQNTLIHLKENFAANGVELSEFFSKSQALKGVINVLGNQTGDYVSILGELENASGMVSEGFDTLTQTTGFKLQKAWNDLKLAMMDFGVVLVPIMEAFAGFVSLISKKFTELGDNTKKVFGFIGTALAASGPILLGLSLVSKGIKMAIAGVALLQKAFVMLAKNPALMAIAISMSIGMGMINQTTTAINDQGKKIVKLTEGAKAYRRIWGVVKFMIQAAGQVLYDLMVTAGGIVAILGSAVTLQFKEADRHYQNVKALLTTDKFGRRMFDFSNLRTEFDEQMEAIEKGIEDTEFELNNPKMAPKSGEELMEDFNKELKDFKPEIDLGEVDLDFGDGGEKEWTQEDLDAWFNLPTKEDLQKAVQFMALEMPGLDNSAIQSSLDEYLMIWQENQSNVVMNVKEANEEIKKTIDKTSKDLIRMQQMVADNLSSGIGDAFADAIVEGENFGESMINVFKQLTKQIIATIVKQQILNALMGTTPAGQGVGMLQGLGNILGITPANDIAFGPSSGRFITGPEGTFSLNPNDSIVAGTNLFGGQQNNNMTVNGYIDGSSIFLSNTRQTNTINRLS